MCRTKELRGYLQGLRSKSHLEFKGEMLVWAITFVIYCEILKSFGTFVNHHWTVCHAKELRRYLQGQGHTLSSKVKNGHKSACLGHTYVVHCEILIHCEILR